MSLVVLVDKVDDDFDHGVLFFGATFGNHEGEGDKGVVGDTLWICLLDDLDLANLIITIWKIKYYQKMLVSVFTDFLLLCDNIDG